MPRRSAIPPGGRLRLAIAAGLLQLEIAAHSRQAAYSINRVLPAKILD